MDYWERLKVLKLYSQERRRERYQAVLMWKISQGLVEGYSRINFDFNPRRGRIAKPALIKNNAHSNVKKAREASFAIKGAKIFNLLPASLRNLNSQTVDMFKTNLDLYLSEIPDQPTIQGRTRAATTNSLIDQIPMWTIQQ